MNNWKMKSFIISVVSVQILLLISRVFLSDSLVFIFTQIIGFFSLFLIPGFIVLRILRLHDLDMIETILIAIGISLIFNMTVGLIANSIYSLANVPDPFTPMMLSATFFIAIITLSILAYWRDKNFETPQPVLSMVDSTGRKKISFALLCLLPVFSVISAYFLNSFNSNIAMLLLVFFISLAPILVAFKVLTEDLYGIAIFMIAISLVLHQSLISNNIWGFDIQGEYYFANLVTTSGHWLSALPYNYNSVLSVVIIPPIFVSITGLSLTWVFKVVYPLLFSLVPVGLFLVFKKQTNNQIAFYSCFFFMTQYIFFSEMLQLARQEIASIFLVLLILLMVDLKMNARKNAILSIIIGFALILSHYSLAFILIGCLILALFIQHASNTSSVQKLAGSVFSKLKMSNNKDRGLDSSIHIFSRAAFAIILFIFAIFWYSFVTDSTVFSVLVRICGTIVQSVFTQFLNPSTAQGLALITTATVSPLHELNKYLQLFSQLLIVIGVIAVLFHFTNAKFSKQFKLFSVVSLIVCFAGVSIPHFASSLNASRLYFITLFFLAPFCAIGLTTIFSIIPKLIRAKFPSIVKHISDVDMANFASKLFSLFLMVLLLFSSGFVYEILHDNPTAISLSNSVDYPRFNNQEVAGAMWLVDNTKSMIDPRLYADFYGEQLLYRFAPTNVYAFWGNSANISGSIFFRSLNVNGLVIKSNESPFIYENLQNSILYASILNKNKIYDNGGSQIYR
jgi:uncharacterized membrane protein